MHLAEDCSVGRSVVDLLSATKMSADRRYADDAAAAALPLHLHGGRLSGLEGAAEVRVQMGFKGIFVEPVRSSTSPSKS